MVEGFQAALKAPGSPGYASSYPITFCATLPSSRSCRSNSIYRLAFTPRDVAPSLAIPGIVGDALHD